MDRDTDNVVSEVLILLHARWAVYYEPEVNLRRAGSVVHC